MHPTNLLVCLQLLSFGLLLKGCNPRGQGFWAGLETGHPARILCVDCAHKIVSTLQLNSLGQLDLNVSIRPLLFSSGGYQDQCSIRISSASRLAAQSASAPSIFFSLHTAQNRSQATAPPALSGNPLKVACQAVFIVADDERGTALMTIRPAIGILGSLRLRGQRRKFYYVQTQHRFYVLRVVNGQEEVLLNAVINITWFFHADSVAKTFGVGIPCPKGEDEIWSYFRFSNPQEWASFADFFEKAISISEEYEQLQQVQIAGLVNGLRAVNMTETANQLNSLNPLVSGNEGWRGPGVEISELSLYRTSPELSRNPPSQCNSMSTPATDGS
ncbi:hypothetical protein LXA43DRAFT_1069095 [Ganoderma leucocontextum]|nr:hypothetical protein LXA43DRAFT_1069095 [Ganoderma leucocontextum]